MRILIKIFFLVAFPVLGFAQTQTTVFTPKGSAVSDTYIIPEFSSSQISAGNNYVATNYPNATRLTDASATYNCHGYAWHISEGGNNVWIGYYTVTAEDIYWTDGSYVEVCSQTFPAKVSYASDNHSAITTSQTDIFKSKWGQLPVMQHNKDYTPYNSSVLKYYGRISGPSLICSTGQFNIGAISGITWSSSNPSGLSINSSTGLATRQNNFNGQATITATISGICPNFTTNRNVVVGTEKNVVDIISVNISCVNNSARANLIFSPMFTTATKIDYYSKDLTNANNPYILKSTNSSPNGGTGGDLTLGAKNRWYSIKMVVTTPCGTVEGIREVYAACSGGGGALRAFPNPTNNQITIQLLDSSVIGTESQTSTTKENNVLQIPFTAQLFDSQGMLRKSTKEGKGSLTIDTSDLPNGIYYLHAHTPTEKLTSQIIVNH
jgi:hypothetical protein